MEVNAHPWSGKLEREKERERERERERQKERERERERGNQHLLILKSKASFKLWSEW